MNPIMLSSLCNNVNEDNKYVNVCKKETDTFAEISASIPVFPQNIVRRTGWCHISTYEVLMNCRPVKGNLLPP